MLRDATVERKFELLRAVIRRLAVTWPLIGLPGALAGCACPDVDTVYLIRQPDDETRTLLEACQDPARKDCMPLCEHLSGLPDGGATSFREGPIKHCELHASNGEYAEVHATWSSYCPGGRRPEGLVVAPAGARGAGELFAQLAQLEAASVPAFQRLARELRAHGAPETLAVEATRARADERRHARVVAALARRFGARVPRPAVPEQEVRSLEAVAIENAVEGCVREAYGAVVAAHQAARATDPVVRRAMAAIAVDETRHAALSYAIDDWMRARLGDGARRRVAEARREAHAGLARDVERPLPAATAALAGLPDAATARRMTAAIGRLAAEAA
ncbi:MAG TPA: ferritin-like domain-containing protein [Polyangia bacterium]